MARIPRRARPRRRAVARAGLSVSTARVSYPVGRLTRSDLWRENSERDTLQASGCLRFWPVPEAWRIVHRSEDAGRQGQGGAEWPMPEAQTRSKAHGKLIKVNISVRCSRSQIARYSSAGPFWQSHRPCAREHQNLTKPDTRGGLTPNSFPAASRAF